MYAIVIPSWAVHDERIVNVRFFRHKLLEYNAEDNAVASYMVLYNSDTQDAENLAKRFSDDILSIEISRLASHYLTVVVVPEFFNSKIAFI